MVYAVLYNDMSFLAREKKNNEDIPQKDHS